MKVWELQTSLPLLVLANIQNITLLHKYIKKYSTLVNSGHHKRPILKSANAVEISQKDNCPITLQEGEKVLEKKQIDH